MLIALGMSPQILAERLGRMPGQLCDDVARRTHLSRGDGLVGGDPSLNLEIGRTVTRSRLPCLIHGLVVKRNNLWRRHGEMQRIVAPWSGRHSDAFLQEPEAVQIQERHWIRSSTGDPVGRLYITSEPALRANDRAPMVVITLTARGAPLGEGLAGAGTFLECGHDQVVQSFVSFTTKAAHKEWGLRE
jgi:hypothetical protein